MLLVRKWQSDETKEVLFELGNWLMSKFDVNVLVEEDDADHRFRRFDCFDQPIDRKTMEIEEHIFHWLIEIAL